MNCYWKENGREISNYSAKQKNLFKSYYCGNCKQRKVCGKVSLEYCCSCYYQNEQERAKEYSNYEQLLSSKKREQKERFWQLQLLKNYLGCKDCKSKEIDAYSLYGNSKLTCWACLTKKEGGTSSPISFSEQSKWYKRLWKIDLTEWLKNFSWLPVNKNCADQWKKDRNHLNNCDCLEKEIKELVDLFRNSLKKSEELLKKCACKTSQKVRVSSDDYAWCERCEGSISVASKKRVIKNRNDPKFWGLEVKEKILCGNCLESKKEGMPSLRKVEFSRYRKVGRL